MSNETRNPVADFMWFQGAATGDAAWLSATGADRERFVGQFAFAGTDERGRTVLARDRLGVNKQFFCLDGKAIRWSNYLVDLTSAGVPVDRIWSVPSGHFVCIGDTEQDYELRKHAPLKFEAGDSSPDSASLAKSVREGLEETFGLIGQAVGSRRVYITMSGGLDSTTIAALARQHFEHVTGVTFSLKDDSDAQDSEDARFAIRVAEDLGIPIVPVRCTTDSMMELLDDTLVYGQDFRDFNVHCGLVNAAIARELRAHLDAEIGHSGNERPIVLTGDTMNELMADYSEVSLQGRVYYRLPRMKKGLLRRFLVNGLDSGDREVGIFAHFGFDVIQPYALCAERYTALPGGLVAEEDAKQRLVEQVMGDAVPDYVLRRPKVRAQAGDAVAGQGVLGAFMRAGIGQEDLNSRFSELLGIPASAAGGLIKAGFYRFTEKHPGVGR